MQKSTERPKKRTKYTNSPEKEKEVIDVCPCGGGQSCIIDRRLAGDWIHEDDVFRDADLKYRQNCLQKYTKTQELALKRSIGKFNSFVKTETTNVDSQ